MLALLQRNLFGWTEPEPQELSHDDSDGGVLVVPVPTKFRTAPHQFPYSSRIKLVPQHISTHGLVLALIGRVLRHPKRRSEGRQSSLASAWHVPLYSEDSS